MKPAIPAIRCGRPLVVMAALLMFLITQPAQAVTKHWVGPNPNTLWTNPNNWNPAGVPVAGDVASLRQNDAINRTVVYNNPSNPPLSEVIVDATGAGAITLQQSGNYLSATSETIGNFGTGRFIQQGGYNRVNNLLTLGYEISGAGTYIMTGGILLVSSTEQIGREGTGSFEQSGGDHRVVEFLTMGGTSTGMGAYNLTSGILNATREYIGFHGTGHFTQSNGNNIISATLQLGLRESGQGTYNLKGGILKTEGDEIIGVSGTGTLTQTGGSNTVTQKLTLGVNAGSSGTYNLQNGSLSAQIEYVGQGGAGSFNQSGGSNTAVNELLIGYGGNGEYYLARGSLKTNKEYIGYLGDGGIGTFTQESGAHTVATMLNLAWKLGSTGDYYLNNGSLVAFDEYIGQGGTGTFIQVYGGHQVTNKLYLGMNWDSSGTYSMQGGSLSATDECIGYAGIGSFTQTWGDHAVAKTLTLGGHADGQGTYDLQDGRLTTYEEFIGDQGKGTFNQKGGLHTVRNILYLGGKPKGNPTGTGNYTLEKGTLQTGSTVVGFLAPGTFTQSGGDHLLNRSLYLGVMPTGNGTYHLKGGNLKAGTEYIGVGGTGEFTQGGGQNFTKTLILALNPGSKGTYNLKGGTLTTKDIQINSGGALNVDNVVTTVTGNVVNEGKVKTTGATVTWNGNFTNNNEYKSDPSKQTFAKDLVVGPTGYLVGYSQDLFIVKNDFKNQSTQTTKWNTVEAGLQFATGPDNRHLLYIPGADLKKDPDGYIENFAWGRLDIAGQTVTLLDGNATAGGALYVREMLGVSFFIAGINTLANIYGPGGPDLNIYYDPGLAANTYLHGRTYSWRSGHGHLMPYHTPVPASVLLLGSGLLGLGLLGFRRKKG